MREVSDGTIEIKRKDKPLVPHNFPSADCEDTMMYPAQSVLGLQSNRGSIQRFE